MKSLFNGTVMLDRLTQKHDPLFLDTHSHPKRPPDNILLFNRHGIVLYTNDKIIDRGVCAFEYLDLRYYKRVQAAMKTASADTPNIVNVQYTLHGVPYDSEIYILKQDDRYLGIIWRTPKLVAFNPR